MTPLIIIIVLQIVIALIVVVVLKRLLDRELEKAAIEKMASLKNDPDAKMVSVYSAQSLPLNVQQQLTFVIKNKFSNAKVSFSELRDLKGGVMIKFDENILDFSLSSRLENFWS